MVVIVKKVALLFTKQEEFSFYQFFPSVVKILRNLWRISKTNVFQVVIFRKKCEADKVLHNDNIYFNN